MIPASELGVMSVMTVVVEHRGCLPCVQVVTLFSANP